MRELTKEDIEKFTLMMKIRVYRTVEKDYPPLFPSKQARRASWIDTAGLYCSFDQETSWSETKDYLINPITYLVSFETPILVFDAKTFCKERGVSEAIFYQGMTSGTLGIHQLPGKKVQGAMWPSQKNPKGKSLVLYTDNIENYPVGFTAERFK